MRNAVPVAMVALAAAAAVAFGAQAETAPTPAPTPAVREVVPRAKFVKAARGWRETRAELRAARAQSASPYSPPANRAMARALAAALYGWTGPEVAALEVLWGGESSFNHLVWNHAGSGAYGIPQALPGRKMAAAGPDWATNPATQIVWGLRYIDGRYGSPSRALAAWRSRSPHWY